MSKNIPFITKQVSELVDPILDEMGFELVDVEYLAMHGKWVLRLYIDKDGGVTIDDCVSVSRELGDVIDIKNIVENQYVLEVSSPGVNRPLKRDRDFIRAIGKKIKVRMVAPVQGRRNFTGHLKKVQEGTLYLEMEDRLMALPRAEVDRANLVYEF